MNFKLFGKTILVVNIRFRLFWAIHSARVHIDCVGMMKVLRIPASPKVVFCCTWQFPSGSGVQQNLFFGRFLDGFFAGLLKINSCCNHLKHVDFSHQNKRNPAFTSCNVQVYNVRIPVLGMPHFCWFFYLRGYTKATLESAQGRRLKPK